MGLKYRISAQIAWSGGVSTAKIYFLFTITIRLEVQFVVLLCNIITRNESFDRNSPISYKTTIEMLQMTPFVAMHRILTGILPQYLQ